MTITSVDTDLDVLTITLIADLDAPIDEVLVGSAEARRLVRSAEPSRDLRGA
jgi:hypothetical protein